MTIGKRQQKKEQTRQAIVAAAIDLFSRNGYEKTSIEELAKTAGIGKSTVYTYFKAKDEIFLAFCEAEFEYIFRALRERVDVDAPLIKQLHTLFMLQYEFVTRNREFGRILVREALFPKTISNLAKETNQRYLDALGEILTHAKERGEIRPELDNFFLTCHFYMLYVGALSGLYTGYLTSIEDVEVGLEILLNQALQGIAL
jgi:AcrR family transcriptional regulator